MSDVNIKLIQKLDGILIVISNRYEIVFIFVLYNFNNLIYDN